MKKLVSFLLIATCYLLPATAYAQGPEPTPDLPYHFEPLPITDAPHDIPINFTTPDFINAVGSYALTVFTLLDKYNVLGIFVVIMLGLGALWWLYSFVTDRPIMPKLNISGALDVANDLGDNYYDQEVARADAFFELESDKERAFAEIAEERRTFKERNRKIKKLARYF